MTSAVCRPCSRPLVKFYGLLDDEQKSPGSNALAAEPAEDGGGKQRRGSTCAGLRHRAARPLMAWPTDEIEAKICIRTTPRRAHLASAAGHQRRGPAEMLKAALSARRPS